MGPGNHRHPLVTARAAGTVTDPGFALVVPFQVILEGSDTDEAWRAARRTGYATSRGLGGNLLMKDRETSFEFFVVMT